MVNLGKQLTKQNPSCAPLWRRDLEGNRETIKEIIFIIVTSNLLIGLFTLLVLIVDYKL